MARVTPKSGGSDLTILAPYEPYNVTLAEAEVVPDDRYNSGPRLKLVWQLEGEADGMTVWDWASIKLGQSKDGQVAKLRTLINAIERRDPAAEVAWVDDETLEYGLPEGREGSLRAGVRVTIRGILKPDAGDPTIKRYRVVSYEPAHMPADGAAGRPVQTAPPSPPSRGSGATRPASPAGRPSAGGDW